MPRNVIVLHTDQQRYDSLGCNGDPSGTTPNIDALAATACVGDRHLVASPVCEPSRASLFTGLYPQAHGVWGNGIALNRREMIDIDDSVAGFDPIEPLTMADMFANAGFDTVSLGKLHLTPNLAPTSTGYPECWELMKREGYADWTGPYYGFRHVEMTLGHGEQPCYGGHYGHWLATHHPEVLEALKADELARKSKDPLIPGFADLYPSVVPSAVHNNAWLADRAINYLQNDRPEDKPFFLFVGFPDPHHPITPSKDILDALDQIELAMPTDPKGSVLDDAPAGLVPGKLDFSDELWREIRRYTAAMVSQVDTAVGRIIKSVKEAGLWEDTVILFTSDHGDYLGDHRRLFKCYHADKSLVHVPFVLHAPGANLPSRFSHAMSNVDVMPTLAQLSGIDVPDDLQGRPLSKILEDDNACAYTYCYTGKHEQTNYTLFNQRYRLTWYPASDRCVLHDHQQDPAESVDLSKDVTHRVLIAKLLEKLKDHALQSTNPISGKISAW